MLFRAVAALSLMALTGPVAATLLQEPPAAPLRLN